MELWDVYDHCFQKTGRIHERGNPLPPGEYHLVVAVYPVNSQGQVLIQKRNPDLKLMPGLWAATGGSALQGISSWRLLMSMRFMATVTICDPEASMACDIISLLRNLPVPTKRREVNSRPPIIRDDIEIEKFLSCQ